METVEKIVESKTKARFTDCDPFNHLNNSKYIDYIIQAREDQVLQHYDFDIYKMAMEEGISWVVAQNHIAYLQPVNIMETLTIETSLLRFDEKTILLEGIMWNENKTQLKAVMWSKQVHYNIRNRKSQAHSPALQQFFDSIQLQLPAEVTFEERVKAIRNRNI